VSKTQTELSTWFLVRIQSLKTIPWIVDVGSPFFHTSYAYRIYTTNRGLLSGYFLLIVTLEIKSHRLSQLSVSRVLRSGWYEPQGDFLWRCFSLFVLWKLLSCLTKASRVWDKVHIFSTSSANSHLIFWIIGLFTSFKNLSNRFAVAILRCFYLSCFSTFLIFAVSCTSLFWTPFFTNCYGDNFSCGIWTTRH
jgi:hypothetical protein